MRLTIATVLSSLLLACGPTGAPTPEHPPPPPATAGAPGAPVAPPAPLTEPPPSGITPDAPFPTIAHQTLENGLAVRVVERHNLPIVELRLLIKSGTAGDDGKVGLALLAGEMLKAGGTAGWTSRQLLEEVEGLGSSINVYTDADSTKIELAVTREHLDTAVDILAKVAQQPRFSPREFGKLKQRETERVSNSARTSGRWGAAMMLYRELYHLPTSKHPYADYDATPKTLKAVSLADCRTWHKTHVTPNNAVLVVAGDVSSKQVIDATKRAFGTWKGDAPSKPSFSRPAPSKARKIFLVDRPGSTQADVYVGVLGPERKSDFWGSAKTANQILGGGVSGRLFLDVREERSLAYSTGSRMRSLANGPVPITMSAGTQTAKAGLTVKALLEHLNRIGNEPPSTEEVTTATRYLSDIFLLRTERVGSVANMTTNLAVWGLADDYYDSYRKAVRGLDVKQVHATAKRFFTGPPVMIVAGDAARIDKPLSHFADVVVVDPTREFAVKRSVKHDPKAPIELKRVKGT